MAVRNAVEVSEFIVVWVGTTRVAWACHLQYRVQQSGGAAVDTADLAEGAVDEQVLAWPQAECPEIRQPADRGSTDIASDRPRRKTQPSSAHASTVGAHALDEALPVGGQAPRIPQHLDRHPRPTTGT